MRAWLMLFLLWADEWPSMLVRIHDSEKTCLSADSLPTPWEERDELERGFITAGGHCLQHRHSLRCLYVYLVQWTCSSRCAFGVKGECLSSTRRMKNFSWAFFWPFLSLLPPPLYWNSPIILTEAARGCRTARDVLHSQQSNNPQETSFEVFFPNWVTKIRWWYFESFRFFSCEGEHFWFPVLVNCEKLGLFQTRDKKDKRRKT